MTTATQILDDGSPIEILRARLLRALGAFERAWSVPGYADDAVIAASACADRERIVVAHTHVAAATDTLRAAQERRHELTPYEREELTEAALSMYYDGELALSLGMRAEVTR